MRTVNSQQSTSGHAAEGRSANDFTVMICGRININSTRSPVGSANTERLTTIGAGQEDEVVQLMARDSSGEAMRGLLMSIVNQSLEESL